MPVALLPSRRSSQPQYPVPIDWKNPVTAGLVHVLLPCGWVDQHKWVAPNSRTNYGTANVGTMGTPYGNGFTFPVASGAYKTTSSNYDLYADMGLLAVVYIQNNTITNAAGLNIAGSNSSGGVNLTYQSTLQYFYWLNTAGEKKLGFYSSWSTQTIEFSGVSNGVHILYGCRSMNNAPMFYIDGVLVGAGTAEVGTANYYYNASLSPVAYESATITSTGVGSTLMSALFIGGDPVTPTAQMGYGAYTHAAIKARELAKNPWQIFSAGVA